MSAAAAAAVETRTLLEVRNLHVNLGQSHVLQGVSFDVPEGGVTALLGRNGVGKTTTLRAILGLVGRQGTVRFGGEDLTSLADGRIEELPPSRDARSPVLARVERALFAVDPGTRSVELDGSLRFLEGAGIRGTLELVADEILALVRDGTPTDEIAIVCPKRRPAASPLILASPRSISASIASASLMCRGTNG